MAADGVQEAVPRGHAHTSSPFSHGSATIPPGGRKKEEKEESTLFLFFSTGPKTAPPVTTVMNALVKARLFERGLFKSSPPSKHPKGFAVSFDL